MKGSLQYIILLAFVFSSIMVNAQPPKPKTQLDSLPALRGFSFHADVLSSIMQKVQYGGDVVNFQAFGDVNLYDKFYPTIELGYSSIYKTISTGATYSSSAPYMRLGFNYNLMKKVDDNGKPVISKNYAFFGVRYGFTLMNYQMNHILMTNDYWNESYSRNYSGNAIYAGWLELVSGVRVNVYKGITLGWNVRLKLALHSGIDNMNLLWYVPGYGNSSGSTFAFNYTVGYTFRFPKRIPK